MVLPLQMEAGVITLEGASVAAREDLDTVLGEGAASVLYLTKKME